MRFPHLLRANHRSEIPHAAIWFDTETDQVEVSPGVVGHKLRFGWANFSRTTRHGKFTSGDWRRFERVAEFWDWVEGNLRERVTVYLFCHNTNFDLPVLDCFGELPRRGWKMTTCVIDAPPTILKFRRGTNQLVILDTLNIWRMPLAGLGKMVGLEKLPMPEKTASTEQWDTYGKNDVAIIRRACLEWWDFLKGEDMGGFAPTLASQAMRTYRHRYMTHKILIDCNVKALELARESYYGGRTECFYLGKIRRRITVLDVNSMYPSVMRDTTYPTVLRGVYKRVSADEMLRFLADGRVCALVELKTDEPCYPVRRRGKLVFPVGCFRAALSSPEIAYAISKGHFLSCPLAAVYSADEIFREFVSDMYARRLAAAQAGNETRAWLWKILMNSLYGKFGQRGAVYERVADTPDLTAARWVELDADTGKAYKWRQLGGIVQRQGDESEGRESHPAIAAHVTAEARMMLWRLIKAAGIQHVFYVDTDALWVTDTGAARLAPWVAKDELGKLKVECVERSAEIFGPKDYRIGKKERHKGVKRSATWLTRSKVRQEKWEGLAGMIARGDLTEPRTATVRKQLRRVYDKGRVESWGRVAPFVVSS